VLLLVLTFTAGWTDAIAFGELGHVFASFMSGNLLFVGLSAVRGERGTLMRASVALVSFALGAFLCELVVGRAPVHRTRSAWLGRLAACFALDAAVLAGFAIAAVLTGDPKVHSNAQVALLALAAFGMGPVGILVGAFEVPGVLANALTGTVLQVSKRVAQNVARREPTHPLRTTTLLALCSTYVLAAAAVTLSRGWAGRAFVPAATLTSTVLLLLGSRRPLTTGRVRPLDVRGAGSRATRGPSH
jgi:uncharacterized membrane protein YoaK (UPF0700 family)